MMYGKFARFLDARSELLVAKMRLVVTELVAERPADLSSLCETALASLRTSLHAGDVVDMVAWVEDAGTEHLPTEIDAVLSALFSVLQTEATLVVESYPELLGFIELMRTESFFVLSASKRERDRRHPSDEGMRRTAISTLLIMLAARDKETATHSQAVAVWSRRIAEGMGLDAATVAFVELCGVLHDIGKVATPDAVLLKEGALKNEEWALMKEHPARGSEILLEIPVLRDYAPAVRGHHERFDGHGYPDRLRGEQIPLASRIVAVADSFHALVSKRCYRNSLAPKAALEMLRDGAGMQWDPQAIAAMLGLFTIGSAETASAARETQVA